MVKKDNNARFNELMQLLCEGTEGISAMAFSSKKSISYGLNNTKFNLPIGFYYSNINGDIKMVGNINNNNISNPVKDSKNTGDSVIILVDSRNEDKPTLLINSSEILKFNKKTYIEDQYLIVVYWEIGGYSYLAYVLKNPIDGGTIISANFATTNYQLDVNRVNCLRLLDTSTCNKIIPLFNHIMEEDKNGL